MACGCVPVFIFGYYEGEERWDKIMIKFLRFFFFFNDWTICLNESLIWISNFCSFCTHRKMEKKKVALLFLNGKKHSWKEGKNGIIIWWRDWYYQVIKVKLLLKRWAPYLIVLYTLEGAYYLKKINRKLLWNIMFLIQYLSVK